MFSRYGIIITITLLLLQKSYLYADNSFFEKDFAATTFKKDDRGKKLSKKDTTREINSLPQIETTKSPSIDFVDPISEDANKIISLDITCPNSEESSLSIQSVDILYDYRVTELDRLIPNEKPMKIGSIYSIIKDESPEDQQKIADSRMKIFNRNIKFRRGERPPEAAKITLSPTYILNTTAGKVILEGIKNIEQYLNSDNTLPCKANKTDN